MTDEELQEMIDEALSTGSGQHLRRAKKRRITQV